VGLEFIQNCIQKVEEDGLETEGIYRLSSKSTVMDPILEVVLNRNIPVSKRLAVFADPEVNVVAVSCALKKYLRYLKVTLIPSYTFGDFKDALG
jgi:hypothetical protein